MNKGLFSTNFDKLTAELSGVKVALENKDEKTTYELVIDSVKILDGYIKTVKEKNTEKLELYANVPTLGNATLYVDITILKNAKVETVDTSKAVKLEELSEDEMMEIMTKLEESPLYELISSYMPEDDYEDDDYWDDEDETYSTFWYEEISADEVEDLFNSSEPRVLWFGSQRCLYCANFAEVLDDSYFDYDYDIYYIDIDDLTNSDRATLTTFDSRLNVNSTPTIFVLQNGKIKDIHTGAMDQDEYYEFLDKNGVK